MPPLTPGDWLTLGGMVVVAVSSFFGVREQVAGVKNNVSEILRQVGAVHKRMDDLARRVGTVELEQARQDERIKNLRNTQRLRMRTANGAEMVGGGEE